MTFERTQQDRYYQLDLLRFIAAAIVVLYHFAFYGPADRHIPFEYPLLKEIGQYGNLGIDLFFMISGYVILLSSWGRSPAQFIAARISRLYPAFWACCTLTFLAITLWGYPPLGVDVKQYAANLTMVPILLGQDYIEGVYWSLFVELRFYFWVFLLLTLGLLRRLDVFLAAWLALTAVNYVYPVKLLESALILDWSHYFIAGALFYRLAHHGVTAGRVAMLVATYPIALYNAATRIEKFGDYKYYADYNNWVICLVVTCIYLAFLLLITGRLKILNNPRFFYLGAITYPLYLLHEFIGFILINQFAASLGKWGSFSLAVAGVFLLSGLVYWLVERPFSKPFRRWLERVLERVLVKRS